MRRKSVLVALVVLAFGLIGTISSGFYVQNQFVKVASTGIVEASYGFPLGWYGYSQNHSLGREIAVSFKVYWLSLESLLLDGAFWVAISFAVSIAVMKSVNMLRKTRASKILSVINI